MSSKILYRVSSVLFLLFSAGHTRGFLTQVGKPPESFPVLQAMKSVHFQMMGFQRSYWDLYVGFGLFASAYYVVAAIWSWQFSNLYRTQKQAVRTLAWPLIVCQVALTVLCCTNFFWAPIVFSSVITLCLIAATLAV